MNNDELQTAEGWVWCDEHGEPRYYRRYGECGKAEFVPGYDWQVFYALCPGPHRRLLIGPPVPPEEDTP